MWKLFHKKNNYVIWDGYYEQEYIPDSMIHDCMLFQNSEKVSIQEVRNEALILGCIPTIILACKSGHSSHEIEINGESHGVFTYHYNEVLGTPNLIYREAIRRINELIKTSGITQTCEIICRADILDKDMNLNNIKHQKHVIMVFDMCRR